MNNKYFISLLLLIAFSFGGCKRYEEGPLISFRSVSSRIINDWKMDMYLVDGEDYTDDFNLALKDFKLSLYTNNTYYMIANSTSNDGAWEVDEDKKYFMMDQNGFLNFKGEIIRLKKNELWIRDEDGVQTIEYHFLGDE